MQMSNENRNKTKIERLLRIDYFALTSVINKEINTRFGPQQTLLYKAFEKLGLVANVNNDLSAVSTLFKIDIPQQQFVLGELKAFKAIEKKTLD